MTLSGNSYRYVLNFQWTSSSNNLEEGDRMTIAPEVPPVTHEIWLRERN